MLREMAPQALQCCVKLLRRLSHIINLRVCTSQASMLTDIRLMKQLNFNAVRASHYPNHSRWCVPRMHGSWRLQSDLSSPHVHFWCAMPCLDPVALTQRHAPTQRSNCMLTATPLILQSGFFARPLRYVPVIGDAGMSCATSTACS